MPRRSPSFLLKSVSVGKPNSDDHCTVVVANGFLPKDRFQTPVAIEVAPAEGVAMDSSIDLAKVEVRSSKGRMKCREKEGEGRLEQKPG